MGLSLVLEEFVLVSLFGVEEIVELNHSLGVVERLCKLGLVGIIVAVALLVLVLVEEEVAVIVTVFDNVCKLGLVG